MKRHRNRRLPFTVAVCESWMGYGGPEEGGWWFDAGEPDEEFAWATKTFYNEDAALAYRDVLTHTVCAKQNEGRYPKHSVCSDGWSEAHVFVGKPKGWPHYQPQYC